MPIKIFIANDDTAAFICPECQKSKTVNVTKYKNIQTAVRVKCKCPCGHSYSVLLERRKNIRKNINLIGSFLYEKSGEKGNMLVTDLSRSGLRIKLSNPIDIQVGEKLSLEFTLDDKERSLIHKKVVVKSVQGNSLGVKFLQEDHFDKLGPYLLFNFD
jgi:hypothetical protein